MKNETINHVALAALLHDIGKFAQRADALYQVKKSRMEFHDYTRYSNRQKTKMLLGGLLGHYELRDMDQKTYELLKPGEIIGRKKYGLWTGEIRLEEVA